MRSRPPALLLLTLICMCCPDSMALTLGCAWWPPPPTVEIPQGQMLLCTPAPDCRLPHQGPKNMVQLFALSLGLPVTVAGDSSVTSVLSRHHACLLPSLSELLPPAPTTGHPGPAWHSLNGRSHSEPLEGEAWGGISGVWGCTCEGPRGHHGPHGELLGSRLRGPCHHLFHQVQSSTLPLVGWQQ